MKKKDFNKKLTLNKQTVANLAMNEMKMLKGGLKTLPECPPDPSWDSCEDCTMYTCPAWTCDCETLETCPPSRDC